MPSLPKSIAELEIRIREKVSKHEAIPSGFRHLDNFLQGGLWKEELAILGGKTGSGKSFFALQAALNAAAQGFKVHYYSLEMSAESLVCRMIGFLADMSPTAHLETMTLEDAARWDEYANKLAVYSHSFLIYDTVYELAEIEKQVMADKPDFVVIDFIQNVQTVRGEEYERMGTVSLRLQKLAKQANCAILALSQLSNTVSRESADSDSLEYKGSGSIAMVADLGFFLVRMVDKSSLNAQIKLILKKNRRGDSFAQFMFNVLRPSGKFKELISGL